MLWAKFGWNLSRGFGEKMKMWKVYRYADNGQKCAFESKSVIHLFGHVIKFDYIKKTRI